MLYITPETIITVSPFRDEAMDVWVPFEVSSESVKDHDETRGKVFGFVHPVKH